MSTVVSGISRTTLMACTWHKNTKGIIGVRNIMLRDYQQEALATLANYWKNRSDPCVLQLATGAGKSWIIAEIVKQTGQPVLVLQPSKEILEQNFEKILLTGVDAEDVQICSASAGSWKIGKITLATIGTIAKHWEHCKRFKIIIIDECDVCPVDRADSQYMKFFDSLPGVRIVGLTATPWRNQVFAQRYMDPKVFCRPLTRIHCKGGDMSPHGEWFWKGGIIYKCDIERLQNKGFLSPTVYHIAEADWSFVRDVAGRCDYDTEEMTRFMDIEANTSRFTQAVVWCMQKHLKTIVFSPNIDMNFRLANCIKALGGTVETMDSDNDTRASRTEKMQRFREGEFDFLVNVGMVGRGVDVPSVDAVLLCRPTKSLSLYMQYVGRCLRIDPSNPDKVAYILDLSGNVDRFGVVEGVKLGKSKTVGKYGSMYEKDTIYTRMQDGEIKVWDQVS